MVIRLILGLVAACASGAACAQSTDSPGFNWGSVAGINVSNARHCGATEAGLAALKTAQMRIGETLYGALGNYAADFEAGFRDGQVRNEQAIKLQGGKGPSGDASCTELMELVRKAQAGEV